MTKKIRTLLVEDEILHAVILRELLETEFKKIDLIDTVDTIKNAVEFIDKEKPDLLFLDINLPDGKGFEVLDKITFKEIEVVFVTSEKGYALKAYDFAALHFIVKPIKKEHIKEVLRRYEKYGTKNKLPDQIKIYKEVKEDKIKRIMLPTNEGFFVQDLDEIIFFKSDGNYTTLHLTGNRKIFITKNIGYFEKILYGLNFYRVHNRYLINTNHITKYIKGRGGTVILIEDHAVPVAESRRKAFLKTIGYEH